MQNVRVVPLAAALAAASLFVIAGTAPAGVDAQPSATALQAAAGGSAADLFMRVVLPDDEAEDAAVTANVKNAIAASIGSAAAQINVETRVAVVTLSGEAATPALRDRAREAAWIVSGVRDVIDRIEVRGTA